MENEKVRNFSGNEHAASCWLEKSIYILGKRWDRLRLGAPLFINKNINQGKRRVQTTVQFHVYGLLETNHRFPELPVGSGGE